MLPLSQSSQGKLFRQSLRALYRADEAQCLNGLIKHEALSLTQRKQVVNAQSCWSATCAFVNAAAVVWTPY